MSEPKKEDEDKKKSKSLGWGMAKKAADAIIANKKKKAMAIKEAMGDS